MAEIWQANWIDILEISQYLQEVFVSKCLGLFSVGCDLPSTRSDSMPVDPQMCSLWVVLWRTRSQWIWLFSDLALNARETCPAVSQLTRTENRMRSIKI